MILVVDDEPAVNDLICDALRLAGYRTSSAPHGMAALRQLREAPVDLVVLDINMPNVDGFEVLTRMRQAGDQTPVIILTARQDRDDTKTGFELGADDFVKKPFGIEELTLRVKAVLRRVQADEQLTTLRIGAIELNPDQHAVTCDGEMVELSATEFRLLQELMEHANRVLSKAQLLRRVWGIDDGLETTVVETYISYLRKKFGPELSIRTVRGVGYQLIGEKRAGDRAAP
jgi:two-component system OmpR family response regulator